MMIPTRVRKLRRVWARIARSASRPSSRRLIASARAGRSAGLLCLLRLDRVAGLQAAQGTERPAHQRLATLEALDDLDRQLSEQPGLDRLESCLAVLDQVHALLVARGAGLALAACRTRGVAEHERLQGHHQRLAAESG